MKNILLVSVFSTLLLAVSCNSASSKKQDSTGIQTSVAEINTPGKPLHISKTDFIDKIYDYEKSPKTWVYKGDKPCIIDFYADWCGPCKKIAPVLEDLSQKYSGKINVYKVNVDQERELAGFFGIQSIPTVLYCPMKGQPQITQGALPAETFEKIVKEFLLAQTASK